MCTIKQHQGEEMFFPYQFCLTVNIFGKMDMNSDSLEPVEPRDFCSRLELTENTVSEFSLVLLQTTEPDHLNSAIQGLCQCA